MWVLFLTIASAVFLGAFLILAWLRVMAAFGPGLFWPSMMAGATALLRCDEPKEMLQIYGRLLGLTGRYTLANFAGLFLGLLPLFLTFSLLAPPAIKAWDKASEYVEVYPPNTATLSALGGTMKKKAIAGRALYAIGDNVAGVLRTSQETVQIQDLRQRHGICRSWLYCLTLEMLDFKVTPSSAPPGDETPYVVVRPSHDDLNFLWPFLGDLEFIFLAVLMGSNIVTYIVARKRR